ncbi:AcrR family transcriptional regulator [Agromyces cerinus]|uniref:TetR/AcrR family transcriptional regulator n=1 Tax=Agromyces cerinus TaxID=33878 RepID=UPI00195C455D|nr:TetR/AcrR family transcriptional regulator [Agromyces cerinus]MBM7832234.1 AcrR family transcriptional regulator [Agromyces cerinus]
MADDTVVPELPRGIALAWGAVPPPQRGPKREFSLAQVLDAAVVLADADGIDAVTMPAVAKALGLTAMSLYRYVASKETLLLLLQEQGMGLPPGSIAEAEGWRAGLESYAEASGAVYRRHPWMLDIAITGVASTPNNLAWLEAGLTALAGTALSRQERVAVVLQVSGHARFRALVERGYADRADEAGEQLSGVVLSEARLLGRLVAEDRFPELHATLDAGALVDPSFDNFDFGLARLLDGVAHYLDRSA